MYSEISNSTRCQETLAPPLSFHAPDMHVHRQLHHQAYAFPILTFVSHYLPEIPKAIQRCPEDQIKVALAMINTGTKLGTTVVLFLSYNRRDSMILLWYFD